VDLPRELQTRGGVGTAQRDFAQPRVLQPADGSLPARQIHHAVVFEIGEACGLHPERLVVVRAVFVVLGQEAVDIEVSFANGELQCVIRVDVNLESGIDAPLIAVKVDDDAAAADD
jgi:hypothetical protein